MEKTHIRIAGIEVEIEHLYDLSIFFRNAISDSDKADISIKISEDDIQNEYIKMKEEYKREGIDSPEWNESALETTAIYRKIAQFLPSFGAIVFHGSAVAYDGKAYIFTARSGTGKTTHSSLWLDNIKGSYIVDGDKPIIRMIDGKPYVCGTPWNGKEKYGTNDIIPLEAICMISRGKENIISEVSFKESITTIIEQTYRSDNMRVLSDTLRIINSVGKAIRFYKLSCNMEPEAAFVSFKGMVK